MAAPKVVPTLTVATNMCLRNHNPGVPSVWAMPTLGPTVYLKYRRRTYVGQFGASGQEGTSGLRQLDVSEISSNSAAVFHHCCGLILWYRLSRKLEGPLM